jgi:preprotein translocase subunit YajC
MLKFGILSLAAIVLWLIWVVVHMQRKESQREQKMSENKNALQN